MDREHAGAIVVAVDGMGSADDAVDWAAAEAATRHRPLRVVHALTVPQAVDPCATGAVIAQVLVERARADQILSSAVARATSVAPDLEVTTAVLDGPVTWALRREVRDAALLVLGFRNRRTRLSRLSRLVADSVSGALTATAPCPVVVVRNRARQVRTQPAVVVALEIGMSGSAALRFAFAAAEQRGVPVTAVDARDAAGLADASAGAALLVLPSVGRRRILRSTPTVGRALLTEPGCPVVVVRTDAAALRGRPYQRMVPWTASSGSD
jgi:nucleotide-binding universal stress UspA family protein